MLKIGITDTLKPSLTFYTDWLKRLDPDVECRVLSHVRKNLEEVGELDGLLLTGGGDVDPRHFGVSDSLGRSKDVSSARDEFEFDTIERALDLNMPILGICRGMQVINVYLGGTLVLDLPSAGFSDHSKDKSYALAHQVRVTEHSLLESVVRSSALDVNSSHHQAVDRLGNGLMPSAVSPDGVVEGAEWTLKDRMPFLLLVQWHPERMENFGSPASKSLGEAFMKEARAKKKMNHLNTAAHSTTE